MTLEEARSKRGWSLYRAEKELDKLGFAVPRRSIQLAERGAPNITAYTLISLMELYWPEVDVPDVLPNSKIRIDKIKRRK